MNKNKLHIIYIMFINIIFIIIMGTVAFNIWNSMGCYSYNFIKKTVYLYSIFGIVAYIFSIYSWMVLTGEFFSLYGILLTFIYIFNYGQFLMWGLGIHKYGELGMQNFVRTLSYETILKIQIISLVCFLIFNFGAVVVNIKTNVKEKNINDKFYIYLKFVSKGLLFITVPVVIYDSISKFNIAMNQGYSSLYYGDIAINPIVKYISYMFIPSFFGYLVGSKFSKGAFKRCTIVFSIYMIINLLSGDRGTWIYFGIGYLWCYFKFTKVRIIKIVSIVGVTIILISATSVIVKFREIGVSNIKNEDIARILNNSFEVYTNPIFEMGQSARVLGIAIDDNLYEKWDGGNTYAASVVSAILPRVKRTLGFKDIYLDNWISQEYLGLKNYGVGLSILAEAYINFGVVGMNGVIFIYGMIFGKLLNVNKANLKNVFIGISSLIVLLPIVRGSLELFLRQWVYGVGLILVLCTIMRKINLKIKGCERK